MLDVRRLRLLRELHRRGTMAAVAKALSYSPASVSQQLAQLEREADVPLLEHVGRGVRLTSVAVLLVGHVDRILAELERAEATLVRAKNEIKGTIRVAAVQTTALWLVPTVIVELDRDYPFLRVELSELGPETALEELRSGGFDLVVGVGRSDGSEFGDSAIEREKIMTETVQLAVPESHPLAKGTGAVSMAELSAETWVAGSPETGWNDLLITACRELGGFEPDIRHRSNDYAVFLNLVALHLGIALVPRLARPEEHPAIAVREVDGLRRDVFVAVRAGGFENPAVQVVTGALKRAAMSLRGCADSSP